MGFWLWMEILVAEPFPGVLWRPDLDLDPDGGKARGFY